MYFRPFQKLKECTSSSNRPVCHWRHISITTTPCWGSRLVSACAHVLCWQSALALSLSVSARARASPAVWHAWVGPLAACLAIAHVAVSQKFDPQRAWAPFCDVICIWSITMPRTGHYILLSKMCRKKAWKTKKIIILSPRIQYFRIYLPR